VRARKRLFIGLLTLGVVVILGLAVFSVYLALNWENPVNRLIFYLLTVVFLGVLGIVSFGIFGIVLTIWSVRSFPSFQHLIRITLNVLYPLSLVLGRVFRIPIEKIQASYIEVNNQLVLARREVVEPEELLILAPHCLQWSECPYKITLNPDNCRRCGKCQVAALLELRDKYRVKLAFATGGTLARRFVKMYKPKAIVAIACERDLSSGIQDTNPLPVLGVLNERPFGPCFNTRVNLEEVEEAVRYFISGPR